MTVDAIQDSLRAAPAEKLLTAAFQLTHRMDSRRPDLRAQRDLIEAEILRRMTPPAEESYALLDEQGDWWAHISGQWFVLGRSPRVMARQAFDAEKGGWISTFEESVDAGAERIERLFGVRS